MRELREVKLPEVYHLLERFLMVDPIGLLPLISHLREKRFPRAYAGISDCSIKTLVTSEEESYGITIWPGDVEFASSILERWGPSRGKLSVGVKHLHSILRIYEPVRAFDEIFTMFVDKEHFVFKPAPKPERLSSEELPKPWTEDSKGIAYGIWIGGKVVSVGSVSGLVERTGFCGAAIWTDSGYRNRGYATSTLSYAVRDALDIAPTVTYPVESNNTPTMGVLEKLGFRFHSSFLHVEVKKR